MNPHDTNPIEELLKWAFILDRYDVYLTLRSDDIIIRLHRKPQAATITFLQKGKEITMLEMKEQQTCPITLVIKDKNGRPAKVDGVPTWASSDESVAIATGISADGLSGNVESKLLADPSTNGVCQITVDADADLGAGVINITGFLNVSVSAGTGQAVTIELVAGTPVDLP